MSVVDVNFPGNLSRVRTARSLRLMPSAGFQDGQIFIVGSLGISDTGLIYTWDDASLKDDDGVSVIRPMDISVYQAGRWILGEFDIYNSLFVRKDPTLGPDQSVVIGLPSGGVIVPPLSRPYFNPTQVGGLFGFNDGISKTAQVEKYSFTGDRSGKAWIGSTILFSDGATSPASGPATASYGMSIYGERPNWNTSSIIGEMDGLNITLRQANGDSCGILSNVFGRVGFFAFLECEAGSTDAAGNKVKAINAQLASVNSRDGGEYGLVLQTTAGTLLSSGIRVATKTGTSWRRYAEFIDGAGQYVFAVDGPSGATNTRSIAPFSQFAGNVGGPSFEYDGGYFRSINFFPRNFASLPSPSGNAGMTVRIADAASPITAFNQIVSAGGGSNTAMLTSDGTNWRALSS